MNKSLNDMVTSKTKNHQEPRWITLLSLTMALLILMIVMPFYLIFEFIDNLYDN